jgi:hypothetical protein
MISARHWAHSLTDTLFTGRFLVSLLWGDPIRASGRFSGVLAYKYTIRELRKKSGYTYNNDPALMMIVKDEAADGFVVAVFSWLLNSPQMPARRFPPPWSVESSRDGGGLGQQAMESRAAVKPDRA